MSDRAGNDVYYASLAELYGGQALYRFPDMAQSLRRIHESGAVTSELLEAAQAIEAAYERLKRLPPRSG